MSKFKVGDRVRRVGHSDWPDMFGEVGEEYTVLEMCGNSPVVIAGNQGADESAFELISPALTIQAGKFYKTRDGRKVKVTVANDGTNMPHHHDGGGEGGHWLLADGKSNVGHSESDIIAEWVDEPVAVAPATATFKVGDRVVFVEDNPNGGASYGRAGDVATVTDGPHDSGWYGSQVVVTSPSGDGFNPQVPVRALRLATPTAIKVGDWVRTDDGDIGIVLHDDGTDVLQFKVGFVGDDNYDHWDWFSDLQLTIVPPGTTKAANDNAVVLKEIDELEQRLAELRGKLAA